MTVRRQDAGPRKGEVERPVRQRSGLDEQAGLVSIGLLFRWAHQVEGAIVELSGLVRILRRSWKLIVALSVTGALLGAISALIAEPEYEAETRLFVSTQNAVNLAEVQQGNSFSQARIKSYTEMVTTPLVLQPVIDSLGLDATPAQLANKIEAGVGLDTVLLRIAVEDQSPVQAAAIAQAVADSLVSSIDSLEGTDVGGVSPVQLTVVSPATAPAEPSSPNPPINIAIGLLIGILVGLATAFLRHASDTRVRGESDLRRISDIPLLGGISFDADATKKPLLTQTAAQSPRAEAFRQIRTNLQFAHVSHKSKAVLITSSLPGEGKSTTAVNLAIALAQAGQSVALVDADLRRPRVDEYLGLERNAGLTTALIGRADLKDLMQPWGKDELYVLTAGQIPPNPSELLGSDAMKNLIDDLEQNFDAVIIDAPPLLPVTDAAVLAQQVGGVVMVIGSSKVKLHDLQKSFESLEMVDADLLGVVINLLPSRGPDAYSYAYYSYESTPAKELGKYPVLSAESEQGSRSEFDEKVLGLRSDKG
ncbi:tyrosine-protein kinase domain-containing protein [Arthrobacter sp. TMT4-20]